MDIEQHKTKKHYQTKWKDFKAKNPHIVMACEKCNKALTVQNITLALKFKCPFCKHIMLKPHLRKKDELKGHSGKHKRDWTKLVDSNGKSYKTLDNATLTNVLTNNIPDVALAYKPRVYFRVLRQNAFIAMTYLCATRVSELIGLKKDKEYIAFPFTREQIYFETINDKKVIVFKDINILKRKLTDSYDAAGVAHRTIPKKTLKLWVEHDEDVIKFILDYLLVMDKKYPNGYNLFSFSRQTAANYLKNIYKVAFPELNEQQLKEKTPYLHWLRHSRLTYVSMKYKFNDSMVKQYAGWGSNAMAVKYVHISADDLLKVMG